MNSSLSWQDEAMHLKKTGLTMVKPHSLVIAMVLVGSGVAAGTSRLWLPIIGVGSGLLLVLFLVIAIPFIRAKWRGEKIDYLEAIYPVSLIFLLNYGLRTLYVQFYPNDIGVRFHPYLLNPQLLNLSLLYVILGFVCLLCGYYANIPVRLANALPSFGKGWVREGQFWKVVILYLFGMAVLYYGFRKGDVVWGPVGPQKSVEQFPLHDYVQNFSLYTRYAVAICLFTGVYKRSMAGQMLMIFVLGSTLILSVMGGSKAAILTVVLLVVFWYNYRRRRVALKTYFFIALIALLFVYPWINTYRGNYASRFGQALPSTERVRGAASTNYQQLSRLSASEFLGFSLATLMGRQHEIDSVAAIIAQTPEPHGYLWGRDFLLVVPLALIPRAIWSTKPHFQDGGIFNVKYWHVGKYAFAGPPYIGDLYMNFGLPGILLGMFFLGMLLRFVYLYLVKNTNASSPGLLFYTFIGFELFRMAGEAPFSTLSYVVKISFFYLPIVHVFMKLKLRSG